MSIDFSFYDDIPIGVCLVEKNRQNLFVHYTNHSFRKALSLEEKASLDEKVFEDIWPGDECAAFAKKLKSPTPPSNATLPYICPDGTQRWALISIQNMQISSQDFFLLWATDISKSKAIEASLQQEVERADATSVQKGNFLATMSHEIRTPMQSVYGLLELAEMENPPENIMTMVRTAKHSASGLLEILDDILDFAKMDSDKIELDFFEVPVRTLVRGTLEAMAVKVQGKTIDLIDDIAEDVPFVIVGDPKRLRQIIINLTGNALKFTQEGSVTIKVSQNVQCIEKPDKGLALRFEIIDTGIGMNKEVASKLFKPFTQADNSTSRQYGGTGLGLSICKKLTELMGGSIGVSSTKGKGSTFWFEIPTEEVSTEANTLTMPKLDGLSVLSVEDHPQGAKEIVKSLQSMGANVESCPTYQEALDLIKRRPFDVGVIDQGLPDGLGLDLIRDIMELRPFMGLIMYTVRDDAGLQHSLQSLGVTYLAKPASRIGLAEAVKDGANKAEKYNIDGPHKLLIAEDTESVRDVLQRQLGALGAEATFVADGKQALEAVQSGEYGILFTDLHMPEMDGYEVVKAIRNQEEQEGQGKHYPVIALTADVQIAQRQVYMSHGFDECLLKPVSLGQFRRLLIRWGLLEEEAPLIDTKDTDDPSTAVHTNTLPPAIDTEAIIEQMGSFDDSTIEMLSLFVEMTLPLIEKIQKAQKEKDYKEIKNVAHSLKGAARSACANILGDLTSKLQDNASADEMTEKLVRDIVTEFERVKLAIESMQKAA